VLLLLLVMFLGGAVIALLMWLGGAFLQGYFYTEPNPQLYWQAPTAGLVMGAFFAFWCMLDLGAGTPPPVDVLQRFTARQDKYADPAREIVAVKKDGTKVKYRLQREADRLGVRTNYKDSADRYWPRFAPGVVAVEIPEDGKTVRYESEPADTGAYRRFVNSEGWFIVEYEGGPTGIPEISRTGRLLANLTLNALHLVFWFLVLWLLMRFQWPHALGFAVCLWGLCTLMILPILIDAAAQRTTRSTAAFTAPLPHG